MQTLRVDVSGRALSFPPDKPVRIGRSIDADVVVASSSVSRAHAELRPGPTGWTLADVGSSGGTFVAGQPVTELPLTSATEVQLGPAGDGAVITVTPEEHVAADAPPAQAPAPPPPPTGFHQPMPAPPAPAAAAPGVDFVKPDAPAAAMAPPVGVPGSMPPPQAQLPPPPLDPSEMTIAPGMARPGAPGELAQPVTGPDLLLVAEGKEYRFRHPVTVTIGRADDNDIVINDQGVSRHHARLVAKPGGWVFENASQTGSFRKGEPLRSESIEEESEIRLGHPVAGEILKVIPVYSAEVEIARAARKRRNKWLLWGGIAAALVLVVGGLVTGLVLVGGKEDQKPQAATGLTVAEKDRARSAVVKLYMFDETDQLLGYGSGSILTPDGKILTNAHVADPTADGLSEMYGPSDEPPVAYMMVSMTDPKKGYQAGKAKYRATLVKSDGNIDAAVVKISSMSDGSPLQGSVHLPTIKVGDSDKLDEGDKLTILGFPGVATTIDPTTEEEAIGLGNPPSITGGSVSTILANKARHIDRFEFDTDARISPGNSGGEAVADNGTLVGIPTAGKTDQTSGVISNRVRPINAVADLLEEAGIHR